jgi:hypothetical protein
MLEAVVGDMIEVWGAQFIYALTIASSITAVERTFTGKVKVRGDCGLPTNERACQQVKANSSRTVVLGTYCAVEVIRLGLVDAMTNHRIW